MDEWFRIVLTSSITIFGGVIVVVLGQIVIKFFIEPIYNQRQIIGEILENLRYSANVYSNPEVFKKEQKEEVFGRFREQSSELSARTYAIPWYGLWQRFKFVKSKEDIGEASSNLMGLSNLIYSNDHKEIRDVVNKVIKLLSP